MSTAENSLVLVGAGGHAVSCIDVIESQGVYRIVGLLGLTDEVGEEVCGYRVLGTDSRLEQLVNEVRYVFVAIGAINDFQPRLELIEKARGIGFLFPTIIANTAYISNRAVIGEGTIVMHGVTISANAQVGEHCIVNSQALIEHDAMIDNFCHISTGVCVNGGAHIGERSFLGSNCTIKHNTSVGDHCFIGMGQQVVFDVASRNRIVDS